MISLVQSPQSRQLKLDEAELNCLLFQPMKCSMEMQLEDISLISKNGKNLTRDCVEPG